MDSLVAEAPREKDAHLWARHPQDWYVEPRWCSKRLFEVEGFAGGVWDPACGIGHILLEATAAGIPNVGSDIVERIEECPLLDFMEGDYIGVFPPEIRRNIVSNPPFAVADDFAKRALKITPRKVALLLPTKWMNGARRGAWLETTPLRRVWLLGPRPSMPPGPVIEAGIVPGNGTVDYCWMVWERGFEGIPELRWLRRTA